jgi:hypothetical protein
MLEGFPLDVNDVMVKLYPITCPTTPRFGHRWESRLLNFRRCVLKSALPQLFPEFCISGKAGDLDRYTQRSKWVGS